MDKKEDALYGLPLEQFTPERDELVKRLRKEGDRDGAARVKKLRKPTVAAWAVNQVARSQPKAIRELGKAAEALGKAQAAVLSGKGSADKLRAASERERAAVQVLMEAARGLLTGNGKALSESTLEDVADTLRAAALDEDTRELVLAGRVDRERRAAGLGSGLDAFALSGAAPRAKAPPAKPEAKTKPDRGKVAAEKEAARQAEAEREEQRRAARAAAKEATTAAHRAEREHELAESRLRNAEDALATAKDTLTEAKAAEREARRARDQAAKEAKRLRAAAG
jgi:hypothetical protein